MIRRPPRSTQGVSSAASDVYKRQELASLKENNVYDLIPRQAVPAGCKVIGSRWVYKVKSDYTFKARLVCQGICAEAGNRLRSHLRTGLPHREPAHSDGHRVSLRLGHHLLDVKTAFLQSPIDTPTFVLQPPGYEKMDAQGKPMIMNLKQAVYGLRTALSLIHI